MSLEFVRSLSKQLANYYIDIPTFEWQCLDVCSPVSTVPNGDLDNVVLIDLGMTYTCPEIITLTFMHFIQF